MTKFRAKLTFILILLIGCSMLIAGIFMAKVLENSHIKVFTRQYGTRASSNYGNW